MFPSLPSFVDANDRNRAAGDFKMTDLLRYARVDPASRGQ
jgi:hypothetical protein